MNFRREINQEESLQICKSGFWKSISWIHVKVAYC